MIRINLLPKDEVPKGVHIKMPAVASFVPFIAAVVIVGACIATAFVQSQQVTKLHDDIEVAREESQRLAPQIARIKQLTKERDEVDRRLDAITSLDRDRYFRVKLMSEVARKLPANMWLSLFEELSPNSFRMEGYTFSNFVVADLLRDQSSSRFYDDIDLEYIERGSIGDVTILKFGVVASVSQPASDIAAGM